MCRAWIQKKLPEKFSTLLKLREKLLGIEFNKSMHLKNFFSRSISGAMYSGDSQLVGGDKSRAKKYCTSRKRDYLLQLIKVKVMHR